MIYKIYSGVKGKLGGAQYQHTSDFNNEEEALEAAKELAVASFFEHIGFHGYKSWDDFDTESRNMLSRIPDHVITAEELLNTSNALAEKECLKLIDFKVIQTNSLDDIDKD